MTTPKPEIIEAPAQARQRLGLRNPLFDEDTLRRAEEALSDMGEEFGAEWLLTEVDRLNTKRGEARAAGWTTQALEEVACAAHDLKGMGATYGYALITDIAALLCRLLECEEGVRIAQAEPQLVEAHIDAIRAALRENVRDRGAPLGRALITALEARIDALGVPAY